MSTVHTFEDRENSVPCVDPGDYRVGCVGWKCQISQGKKTKGCDMLILDMLVIGHNSTFKERIPIHESCARKLDTFIKSFDIRIASTGKRPQKGDNLEFMSANVLGTSGWVRLKVTDFEFEDGGKGKKNEIDRYLTDREKYPKTAVPDLMGVKAEEETFDDPGIAASAADDEF